MAPHPRFVIRPVAWTLLAVLAAAPAAWPAPTWALREAAVVERPKALSGLEEELGGPGLTTRRRALFQLAGALLGATYGGGIGRKAAKPTADPPMPQAPAPSAPWKQPVFVGIGAPAGAFVGHGLGDIGHDVTAQLILERCLDAVVPELQVTVEQGLTAVILVSPDVATEDTVRAASTQFPRRIDYAGIVVAPLSAEGSYRERAAYDPRIIRVVAAVPGAALVPSLNTVYVTGLGGHPADNLLPAILAEVLARWSQETGGSRATGWAPQGTPRSLSIMTVDLTPYSATRDLDAEWVWKVFTDRFA